jgi:hypothetical protein
MKKTRSNIRTWFESRVTGKLTSIQWDFLRGRYSNQQLKAMTRERIRTILKEA